MVSLGNKGSNRVMKETLGFEILNELQNKFCPETGPE